MLSQNPHAVYMRGWFKRNPGKYNFGGNRVAVLERDNYRCVKCGMTNSEHFKKWKREITVDHIDGSGCNSKVKNNDMENLQTLCLVCHGKKDNPKKNKKYCIRGHDYRGKNLCLDRNGYPSCLLCKPINGRIAYIKNRCRLMNWDEIKDQADAFILGYNRRSV